MRGIYCRLKAIVTYVGNYCQWNLKISNELPIFSWLRGFHNNYESFIGGHCLKQADLLLIEITLIIGGESRPMVKEGFREFENRYQLLIFNAHYFESFNLMLCGY